LRDRVRVGGRVGDRNGGRVGGRVGVGDNVDEGVQEVAYARPGGVGDVEGLERAPVLRSGDGDGHGCAVVAEEVGEDGRGAGEERGVDGGVEHVQEYGDGQFGVSLVEGVNACGFVLEVLVDGEEGVLCDAEDGGDVGSLPGVHERVCDLYGVVVDVGPYNVSAGVQLGNVEEHSSGGASDVEEGMAVLESHGVHERRDGPWHGDVAADSVVPAVGERAGDGENGFLRFLFLGIFNSGIFNSGIFELVFLF